MPLCWEPAVAASGLGGSFFRSVSGRGSHGPGAGRTRRAEPRAALSPGRFKQPGDQVLFSLLRFPLPAFVRSGCQEDKSLGPALALPQPEELEAVTAGAAAGGTAFHWGSALGLPRWGRGAAVSPSQSRAWTKAPFFQLPSAAAGAEAHPGAGPGARARGGERRRPPAGRTCPVSTTCPTPQGNLPQGQIRDVFLKVANRRAVPPSWLPCLLPLCTPKAGSS